MMKEISAATLAEKLFEIQAVQFRFEPPYTWSSGWKSPIYCDFRLTLSYPELRSGIKQALCELILKNYPNTEVIAGVATAGIPQGALVADALQLPFVYVRSEAKTHGKENLIEGKIIAGAKTILVEDVISTGKSSLKAAEHIRLAGMAVEGTVGIFSYGFEAAINHFLEAGIRFSTLLNYETLVQTALETGKIGEKLLPSLKEWRLSPDKWGQ